MLTAGIGQPYAHLQQAFEICDHSSSFCFDDCCSSRWSFRGFSNAKNLDSETLIVACSFLDGFMLVRLVLMMQVIYSACISDHLTGCNYAHYDQLGPANLLPELG